MFHLSLHLTFFSFFNTFFWFSSYFSLLICLHISLPLSKLYLYIFSPFSLLFFLLQFFSLFLYITLIWFHPSLFDYLLRSRKDTFVQYISLEINTEDFHNYFHEIHNYFFHSVLRKQKLWFTFFLFAFFQSYTEVQVKTSEIIWKSDEVYCTHIYLLSLLNPHLLCSHHSQLK